MDLSPNCIEACRRRFGADSHIRYFVNDGLSLDMVPGDYDLIFSFDSLVHAEIDVIDAYLSAFGGLLGPEGICFIHHSNMAGYVNGPLSTVPPEVLAHAAFRKIGRAETVDAALVATLAREKGLAVVGQEIVMWGASNPEGEPLFSDCFSLMTRAGSRWDRPARVIHNDQYMSGEASGQKRLGELYNAAAFIGSAPSDNGT